MSAITEVGREFVKERRDGLEQRGDQLLFYISVLRWVPQTIKRYPREVMNILAEVPSALAACP